MKPATAILALVAMLTWFAAYLYSEPASSREGGGCER